MSQKKRTAFCDVILSDGWTGCIENCYTVTLGYRQQVCKIPKRSIANSAGRAKFKTACQKIQYQRKNRLITYFSLCSMWSPSSSTTKRRRFCEAEMFLRISPTDISSNDKKKLSSPLMPARLIYISFLVKLSASESPMFRHPFGYILYFVETIHPS